MEWIRKESLEVRDEGDYVGACQAGKPMVIRTSSPARLFSGKMGARPLAGDLCL
jgi:hypothetical protein